MSKIGNAIIKKMEAEDLSTEEVMEKGLFYDSTEDNQER